MKKRFVKQTLTMLLAFTMVFTMMPLVGVGVQEADAAAPAPGGAVASNNEVNIETSKVNTVSASTAFGSSNVSASYNSGNKTLTITLNKDVVLSSPVKFVKGNDGDKIVLNLNTHTITGKAGITSGELSKAIGGNAIEIAADAFDVEIKGKGSVVGGKGGKWNRPDYSGYRLGAYGGAAVFFCKRIDKVHDTTQTFDDIIDEGYHPDKLEHGLTITQGANLIGGAGADVTLEDWKYNLSIGKNDLFSLHAGKGGNAVGQVFTSSHTEDVFEEVSYAKIVVEKGRVTGGAGGGVNLGDQLLTTTDIQKISEIKQFMQGKSDDYDFNSYVMDKIKFKPGIGGNGIEFYAGRKYIDIEKDGTVSGGAGGRFTCSDKASMVKSIDTECGYGGKGIYVCGDTGLKNTKPTLTASSWSGKNKGSDDVGIYIAGRVEGGSSPSTTLLGDSSGGGGEGLDNDFESENLCKPYTVYIGHNPQFDADRGIVLVADGGKVFGGAAGAPNETNINGGLGADAMNGGATGGYTSSATMSASYFVINGELTGGYGSSEGGSGFRMKEEKEYLDDTQSSAYFCGVIYGNGTICGGDSGEWPHIGAGYTTDSNRVITYHGYAGDRVIRGEGISLKFGSHTEATTIGSEIRTSAGKPAKLMTTSGTFSVTPTMTSFERGTAPTSSTKLSCTVKKPNGYNGKVYITWSAEYENTNPRSIRRIEGANGAYNNLSILSNSDYPYGWKKVSYGYEYHINAATLEHIAEAVKYNDGTEVHIYCHALLEDGRFVDNEDIWFSKERRSPKGWDSSGGGSDPSQDDIDAESALYVTQLIDAIPATVTLDNADAVNEAWEAYEALNDNAKSKVWPSSVQKLQNAKARIEELEKESVDGILGQIEELETSDAVTSENAQTIKSKIDEIRGLINALTPEEQAMLASTENEEELEKLDAVEQKVAEVISGAAVHTHLMQHVIAKEATCSEEGSIEHYKCMTCGKKYANIEGTGEELTNVTTPTDSTKHKYGVWKKVKAPTCTTEGSKERVCEHNAAHKETESIPIDPNAHSWDGGRVTKQPAVGVKGVRTYTCTRCGKTRTESIAALPQPYVAPPAPAEIQDLPYVKASKPAKGKKAVTVKWKKVSKKNQKKIGGIEVQVTGPGVDTVVTAGKKKSSKKVKGLMPKQVYSCRVRAYNYIGGVKHVSAWSNWKTAKTK